MKDVLTQIKFVVVSLKFEGMSDPLLKTRFLPTRSVIPFNIEK